MDFSGRGHTEGFSSSDEHRKSDAGIDGTLDCLCEGPQRTDGKRCAGNRQESRIERCEGGRFFADAYRTKVCHSILQALGRVTSKGFCLLWKTKTGISSKNVPFLRGHKTRRSADLSYPRAASCLNL